MRLKRWLEPFNQTPHPPLAKRKPATEDANQAQHGPTLPAAGACKSIDESNVYDGQRKNIVLFNNPHLMISCRCERGHMGSFSSGASFLSVLSGA